VASILDRDERTGGYAEAPRKPHLTLDLLRQIPGASKLAGAFPTAASLGEEFTREFLPGEAWEVPLMLAGGPGGKIATKAALAGAGGVLAADAEASPLTRALRTGKTALRDVKEGAAIADVLDRPKPDTSMIQGYLPHTPGNQHPDVGTRYHAEDIGGLDPKVQRRIEELKGSSLVAMPWDSTSRNRLITSVSGRELPRPVLTTGGQDFARDTEHVKRKIGGASNFQIAKRIQKRNAVASKEGIQAGGTGQVYMMPSTMAAGGENFSTMPAETLIQLLRSADLPRYDLDYLTGKVRNAPFTPPGGQMTRPFGDFVGFHDPDVEQQILTGLGQGAPAGELRKAIARQLRAAEQQKLIGFNDPDLAAAMLDPSLAGVGRGHVGNTLIETVEGTPLSPSTHPSYDTDFAGQYAGTLGHNVPMEVMMPKTYSRLLREMTAKGGPDPHVSAISAMEKRGEGFSEMVDNETIDSFYRWLESQPK
jgi:hypothetical protein